MSTYEQRGETPRETLYRNRSDRQKPNGHANGHDAAPEIQLRPPAPFNLEAEQALLGAILVENEAHDRVSSFVEPEHFYDPLHQQIYETATKLIATGKQVDPITLKMFFEGAEPIDANLTVPQYLGRLAANATTIINARDYGRTIYDLATRRQLITIAETMRDAAFDSPVDFDPRQQIEEAETRLLSLGETHPDRLTEAEGLLCLDDIKPRDSGDDLWRDVFGPGEVGTLFAISQAGKGFWSAEFGKRLVLGRPMFGRATRGAPVLQVQYEGGRGLKRRIAAVAADLSPDERALFAKRYAWRQNPLPLGRGSAGDQGEALIIRDARALEKRAGEPVGLITVDTAAKALPGESLNDDDAVGLLLARCRRIASSTGATVMIVAHPGHDNKGRPAGSYQLLGSSEFMLRIDVDAPASDIKIPASARRTVIGEKIKEGESGTVLGAFNLQVVDVWARDDGSPVTSCVVVEGAGCIAAAPAKPVPQRRKLTPNQKTMLSILREAGPMGLSIEDWNERARDQGIGVDRKATLYDCKRALQERELVFEGANGWFAKRDDSG